MPLERTSSPPTKKQADRSLYTWCQVESASTDRVLNPKLALTLKLKQNYLPNPKGAKSGLLGQPDCPIFPDRLWIDIILN